ncbi:MAG TPA: zf-HC2 domain-containing protein [Sedimentisphaerales bacterium]|nr:zf-HC2 domain-containing protein [Sedimentisphaerales bacterium]
MNNQKNDCQNRREAIAALVLGEIEPQDADTLREHIAACESCRLLYQALTDEEESIRAAFEAISDRSQTIQHNLVDQFGRQDVRAADKVREQRKARDISFIWRTIMRSKLTKLAAAAVVIAAVLVYGWHRNERGAGTKSLTYFSLISQARAAEAKLFYQEGITHIVNEIVVYATSTDKTISRQYKSDLQEKADKLNSFLEYNWLPMCSVQASGRFRFNQLQLPAADSQPYTIVDESWYDSATGNFARVLKLDEEMFFANSYDGQFVYASEAGPDGTCRLIKEQAADDFTAPQNPAEFLGITAGLPSTIDEESGAPIREIWEGNLADGTAVRIAKAGFTNLGGELTAYWLFKVRKDDSTIAEMEFIIAGKPQLLIRRVLCETVGTAGVSWSLDEFPEKLTAEQEAPKPVVKADMVIPNVSVEHMVEKAKFETYIFAKNPPWAGHREIVDCLDPPSPGYRMFFIAYRADDGRHVVMVQSHSYNKMLGNFAKQGQQGQPVYTSPNGFKVWGGGPDKWYSEILLSSARACIKDPPADDRIGYVLESPAGTFPALAVNGPLTEEELHSLIDSLVAAREYAEE